MKKNLWVKEMGSVKRQDGNSMNKLEDVKFSFEYLTHKWPRPYLGSKTT